MSTLRGLARLLFLATPIILIALPAQSETDQAPTAAELATEIQALKQDYETRIRNLEAQLDAINAQSAAPRPPASGIRSQDNTFNPAIGVILNAAVANFSAPASEISGFQLGHESERGQEGIGLIETEFNFSANIDDKFFGSTTVGVHTDEGAETFEIEEAYVQTLPSAGLPDGLRVKAGRAFWTLGYLNEHHPHADDFADRPLPYRVFIDKSYNDNGLEFAYVFPTDMFAETGVGLFRGDDFPFGGSDDGIGASSAYARLGGDIGSNQSFRIGAYVLNGSAAMRGGGHAHGAEGDAHGEEDEHGHEDEMHADEDEDEHGHEDEMHADEDEDEHGHEDEMHAGEDEHEGEHHDPFAEGLFTGDSMLYGFDVRYTWAPTGNPREQEITLQGEYFWRAEDGYYAVTEGDETEFTQVDGTSSGWYVQGTYKFNRAWRIGARYSRLDPISAADVTSDDEYEVEHNPSTISVMGDWTNSEFGRIRLQFNRESLNHEETDNQLYLQYIMSLGAHAAHAY